MNERTLRPGNIAAAAVVLGGILLIVAPQHGWSIVRLTIVTIAAGAGLYALAVNAPATWWSSPFDRTGRGGRKARASAEIDWIRSTLSGRRQRIDDAAPLPPETLRLLQPLIQLALEREGLDPREGAYAGAARRLLSARTWAVLDSDPLKWPARSRTRRPDERRAAEVVNDILDELERLGDRAAGVATQSEVPSSGRAPDRRKEPRQQLDISSPNGR